MKFIMDVYKEKYFAKYGVFFTFVIWGHDISYDIIVERYIVHGACCGAPHHALTCHVPKIGYDLF
jgi:hypothetical protein